MSKTSAGVKKSASKTPGSTYPAPFEKAPASLEPFLPQLDPAQIYITHIDRHGTDFKRQIFFFAVLVNSTVAGLLLWRIYIALPKYVALVQAILGYASTATVDTKRTTKGQQAWIILRRTGMMILDYLLLSFMGPWPLTFFFERPSNPVTWRWKIGFKTEEAVVRVSRNWTGEDLMKGAKRGGESPFFKTRIQPAIDEEFMRKTAYLMMGGNWDLDFGLMEDAHVLLKESKIKAEDLDKVVLAHQEGAGWLSFKFGSTESSVDVGLELRKAMEGIDDAEKAKTAIR